MRSIYLDITTCLNYYVLKYFSWDLQNVKKEQYMGDLEIKLVIRMLLGKTFISLSNAIIVNLGIYIFPLKYKPPVYKPTLFTNVQVIPNISPPPSAYIRKFTVHERYYLRTDLRFKLQARLRVRDVKRFIMRCFPTTVSWRYLQLCISSKCKESWRVLYIYCHNDQSISPLQW